VEAAVFERVATIMAAMREGDRAAPFALYSEFGAAIAASVRRELGRRGVRAAPRGEVDGMVMDVCLELLRLSAAWQPQGGALPWVWARHRVANIVDAWVGQHASPLEPHTVMRRAATDVVPSEATSSVDADVVDMLDRLASHHPMCGLLRDALTESGTTDRDQRLLLEVGLQRSLGDRAPAATVAAQFGLRADAVRQQVKRVRDRVRRLAAHEPRYAPLADLGLLAA
jgi:hypothetical protein